MDNITNSKWGYLKGIDISTNYGLAVGSTATNTGYMFQFNGSSWSLLGTESGSNFTAVSCDVPSNPTQCWIVGQEKVHSGRSCIIQGLEHPIIRIVRECTRFKCELYE